MISEPCSYVIPCDERTQKSPPIFGGNVRYPISANDPRKFYNGILLSLRRPPGVEMGDRKTPVCQGYDVLTLPLIIQHFFILVNIIFSDSYRHRQYHRKTDYRTESKSQNKRSDFDASFVSLAAARRLVFLYL